MDNLEIITTSDGSHTVRNIQLNETYHSVHGAVQESMHVFIKNGLDFFRMNNQGDTVSVLEVGFGTGLNAFVTLQYAVKRDVDVRYTTIEAFPLSNDVLEKLNYGGEERTYFDAIHRAPWGEAVSVAPRFELLKLKMSLHELAVTHRCDVIYFDAFAPSVQPDMWTITALNQVTSLMREGGVFVTYSARGQLKRDLRELGLAVETLPGPPGKNEMVRAINTVRKSS